MATKGSGSMSPILVEVKIKCPTAGIECIIMRPGYSTGRKGLVKCPHCGLTHAFHLEYDPSEMYKAQAPKVKGDV